MAQEGTFRMDLYYRLAVVKIEVPSLNQRREDILPLAKFFLDKFTKKFGKDFTNLAPDAIAALERFSWTGNIRELRNLIERAVLLGTGSILTLNQLGLENGSETATACEPQITGSRLPYLSPKGINLPKVLKSIEKQYFDQALEIAAGNTSKAARLLNLSRDKFRYRIRKKEP